MMQKRILLSAILVLAVFSVYSQTEKGRVLLSGSSSISYSSQSVEAKQGSQSADIGKQTDISISPSFGVFVANGLAIGGTIDYAESTFKPDGGDKITSSSTLVGPFVRYYFGNNKSKPFLSGEMAFGNGEFFGLKMNTMGYAIGGGIAIFVSESAAIELGAGYSVLNMEPKDTSNGNFEVESGGVALNVGVTICF